VVLQVPDEIEVRKVDLAVELQILAFHVARKRLVADGPQIDPALAEPVAGVDVVNGHVANGQQNGSLNGPVNGSAPLGEGVR